MQTVDLGEFTVGEGHPPRIMGVLNMSIESNWNPSVESAPDNAARLAKEMLSNGADIIDIGLQSANPKNDWLPPEVEFERLNKALAVIDQVDDDSAVFSIETRYSEVADEALSGGFDIVNDVCGFADPEMPDVCEAHDSPVIKMASPPDIRQPGHLKTIDDVFEGLQRGGFTDKTIIDPAFGNWFEPRTFEDNWEMFRRLREFRTFGRPILTATNREDFLGTIAGKLDNEDQLYVSLAAAALEVDRGADIIRTHDIPQTRDVVDVAHHLKSERAATDSPRVTELQNVTSRELDRYESLYDTKLGALSERQIYVFQIEAPSENSVSNLGEIVDVTGVTQLYDMDRMMLIGSHTEFESLLDELEDADGFPAELSGAIRHAIVR